MKTKNQNFILTILLLFTIISFGQAELKFDIKNINCINKWVAYPINKDSTYTYGFIYFDEVAGLTFNDEGFFKVDKKNKFVKIETDKKKEIGFIKVRLEPSNKLIAEIPEKRFKELKIKKIPDWLESYKKNENTAGYLFRLGYMYNGWNEFETALTYLEKANKMDSNYEGLQTELAFSYNALKKFDLAEKALQTELIKNPNNCYTFKELAYSYFNQNKISKSIEIYNQMSLKCKNKNVVQETSFNITYYYFTQKDKTNFNIWCSETKKIQSENKQVNDKLEQMKKLLEQ